ncbi:MAG: ECF transporter S component [Veillonella sp.]|nr:ECF transporter S component [Veillonella sp.]
MNNIERPLDDNSTVSIHDNEKLKQVERKEAKKEKKSGITIRELTIIGLLAGITIALGLSGYGIIPLGPLFINPIISVLPRILFPVLAYLVYLLLWKAPQGPRIIVSAFMGTVFHTIMVMGLIFLLYADMFALKMNLSPDQVLGSIVFLSVTHGIPEAVFAAVIVTPVAMALRKVLRKDAPKKTKGEAMRDAKVTDHQLGETEVVETK